MVFFGKKFSKRQSRLCRLYFVFAFAIVAFSGMGQNVPDQYKRYFKRYNPDSRSYLDKALEYFAGSEKPGRSIALLSCVYQYPQMSQHNLPQSRNDIELLTRYLIKVEKFDEVIVLSGNDFSTSKYEFFFQEYLPNVLKNYSKPRFLYAFSGHGMLDDKGYLLYSRARSLKDKTRAMNMSILRQYADEVVKAGHHSIFLINACHSGAFAQASAGESNLYQDIITARPGAHVITSGGTNEPSWADGDYSIFFKEVMNALSGESKANRDNDNIITMDELSYYLKYTIAVSESGRQSPIEADLFPGGSSGQFYFLSRSDLGVVRSLSPSSRNLFVRNPMGYLNSTSVAGVNDIIPGTMTTTHGTKSELPGVYLTQSISAGTQIKEYMIRIVTGTSGNSPINFNTDLRGGCVVKHLEAGTKLEWTHIGICN